MTYVLVLVVLALAFPWGAAPVARRLARVLPPREACWALTGGAVLLAGGTVAALVGLFQVPFLAGLEQVPLSRVVELWPAAVPLSAMAGAAMLVQLVLLLWRSIRQRSLLRHAWESVDDGVSEGDVLILPGMGVDAFALPAHRDRGARVVITSGMVRALEPGDREVLMAHERAHLAGRHHVLSVIVDLAAMIHPGLGALRAPLAFHLERWADEVAAAVVGNRRAAAAAIARAALACAAPGRPGTKGYPLLSATSGPVPQRIEALLLPEPAAPSGRVERTRAAALTGTVAGAALAALALSYGLHEYVEYASGVVRGL
ncbi:M48 family metalloprotease [Streptomyces sp. 8L]|uniref:M48 family metalloprotease n=1 Tax=Streptomyces sp. 8L TaxID=2877242 RepID=UPI001CD39C09|nr:M48 family metalloprotease [Streptomyces sp. 8L]MCA1219445.1 M48 family metalloprotease [Streptomyces sp. 8L]